MDLSDKVCCVYDHGLFTSLAVTLAPHFKTVYYSSPWQTSFPRSNATLLGDGIPGVTRLNDIWPKIDEIDLFVFPDIFDGPLQVYLRRLGKRVWGSGLGESLEFMRGFAKRTLRQLGLPVGPYVIKRGLVDLRRHLQAHDDQYVKISRTRGDMETFHAKTYREIEPRLDELEHSLGAKKYIMEFVVEEPIEAKVEVGYDGFSIDGRFPKSGLFGVETKDAGYVGEVVPYSDMPGSIRRINSALSPLFKELTYRGFFSSEIRVAKDGTPYLIDPCCRMASPPGELYQYLIENLAEVIWAGAEGEIVEPKWRHKWGAQLILKSAWAEQNWQAVEFPSSIADNVKLHYHTMIGGKNYFVPQAVEMPEIGSVVAGGNTKDEAIKAVSKIAEKVSGYDIEYHVDALERAAEGMGKLKNAA